MTRFVRPVLAALLLLAPIAARAQSVIANATTLPQFCVDRTVTPWVIGHARKDGKCVAEMTQDPVSGGLSIAPGVGGVLASTGGPVSGPVQVTAPGIGGILDYTSNNVLNANVFSAGAPQISLCGRGGAQPGGANGTGCTAGLAQYASQLLQFTTVRDNSASETGLFLNMYSNTGYVASDPEPGAQNDAKVGFNLGVVFGPNAGHGWAEASSMTLLGGHPATNMFFTNHEMDVSNGTGVDPAPGSGSQIYNLTLLGGAGGNPATAELFISPDTGAAGQAAGQYGAHWGIGVVGQGAIKDYTFVDLTWAKVSLELAGQHSVGLRTYNGTFSAAAIWTAPTQKTCFGYILNTAPADPTPNACWHNDNTNQTSFDQNGGSVLQLLSGTNGVNLVSIQNNGSGFGPVISATGADANIPLTLQSKGAFPVQSLSKFAAPAYQVGSTDGVSCAAGTVNLSTHVVTNGIVTHC